VRKPAHEVIFFGIGRSCGDYPGLVQACDRPEIKFKQVVSPTDTEWAAPGVERTLFEFRLHVFEDEMPRCEGGVSTQIDFEQRDEPPEIVFTSLGGSGPGDKKCGFRKVHLGRYSLHRGLGNPLCKRAGGGRVPENGLSVKASIW
jgi:hypothetical protein